MCPARKFGAAPITTIKTMSATIQQLADAFADWQENDTKFTEKGNKAAGTRARKALMELTKLAKARRAEITEEKAGE